MRLRAFNPISPIEMRIPIGSCPLARLALTSYIITVPPIRLPLLSDLWSTYSLSILSRVLFVYSYPFHALTCLYHPKRRSEQRTPFSEVVHPWVLAPSCLAVPAIPAEQTHALWLKHSFLFQWAYARSSPGNVTSTYGSCRILMDMLECTNYYHNIQPSAKVIYIQHQPPRTHNCLLLGRWIASTVIQILKWNCLYWICPLIFAGVKTTMNSPHTPKCPYLHVVSYAIFDFC